MSGNNSSLFDEYSDPSLETATSRTIKFFLLLIFQIFSVCCSLFLIFHLIIKSTFRRRLQNETIIALLLVSFFQTISDLPMTLNYLRHGQAASQAFCLMWNFFALSNYAVGVWTMTWASIERHFLIFHQLLFTRFRGKLLFHYIPLLTSLNIPWIYYLVLIFFYPCANNFYQTFLFCGWCCYAYNERLVFFNWLTFGVIPVCSISVLNLGLIVRVVSQKRRVQRRIHWCRHRRMVVQLINVSSLYILFDSPTIIIGLIRLRLPTFAANIQILYLYYIVYLLPILVPFVCLSTFREIWSRKRVQIHPPILLLHNRPNRHQKKVQRINSVTDGARL